MAGILLLPLWVCAQGVNFRPLSYTEAIELAAKENKMVFIDFYTTWCGPCKRMSKEVFPQQEVGEYFNRTFISLKLDAEKENGLELAKKYAVKAFPTFVVLSPDGTEVFRTSGYRPADEFVEKILVRSVGIYHLVMGFNHHFGKGRSSNYDDYASLARKYGFYISRENAIDIHGLHCSSSVIRESLNKGDVSSANLLLGYPYRLVGHVVGGNRLGRTLGYPTANVELEDDSKLVPANGVYACHVHTEGQNYFGMLNIGKRPTIHNNTGKSSIEVHILDFNHDIYSEIIVIEFIRRMRDEHKFASLEALKEQLAIDERTIRDFFNI